MELLAIDVLGQLPRTLPSIPEEAQEAIAATRALYANVGHIPPWIGYVALEDGECVGACAFKSPPRDGSTEIAYYTFPSHEGLGFATAMAQALIEIARRALPDIAIVAQTLAEDGASPHILRKLGFDLMEEFEDPQDGPLWEWRLAPAA